MPNIIFSTVDFKYLYFQIHELFSCIREATKDPQCTTHTTMGEGTDPADTVKATFEVRYVGRSKVSCKKLSSDMMDSLALQLLSREEEQLIKQLQVQERRQRHTSGTSIKVIGYFFNFVFYVL